VNDVLATSNCHRYLRVKTSYPFNDTQAPAFSWRPNIAYRLSPIANRQSPTSTRHRHIDSCRLSQLLSATSACKRRTGHLKLPLSPIADLNPPSPHRLLSIIPAAVSHISVQATYRPLKLPLPPQRENLVPLNDTQAPAFARRPNAANRQSPISIRRRHID